MSVYEDIASLKKYAIDERVPIMQDGGIDFLTSYIEENAVSSVLEVGTAIGYSAIMMALSNPNLKITSIERDQDRYLEAVKNVKNFKLEDRITLLFGDALDVEIKGKFDLIFIDAAKGQNIKFFEKFSCNLNKKGTIITDNIDFHGMVDKDESEIESRNVRGIVRKIKAYLTYLEENDNFVTEILHIGDGISISRRKD